PVISAARVEMRRLDDYLSVIPPSGALIKIDVEGAELKVLRGATSVMGLCNPKIIFESLRGDTRAQLHQFLIDSNYVVHRLPWIGFGSSSPLSKCEVLKSKDSNFLEIA